MDDVSLAPKPKSIGNAILCSDIIKEVTNKYGLIGVFSGHIIIEQFPGRLRFALYVEVFGDGADETITAFKIFFDNKQIAKIEGKLTGLPKSEVAAITLNGLEATVDGPCEIRVDASVSGGKYHTIIRKKIVQGEVSKLFEFPTPSGALSGDL